MNKISNHHTFSSSWTYEPAPESADHIKIKPRYELFINGSFVKPVEGSYFDSVNPANGQKLSEVAQATAQDVDLAVQAAKEAFPTWSGLSGKERGNTLSLTEYSEQYN